MTANNPARGIALMVTAMLIFAIQDGLSRHLAERYGAITVTAIRYWFFGAFVLVYSVARGGGLRQVARSHHLGLQIFRGVLLAIEIIVTITAFVLLGLVETHALFSAYPLIVVAIAGPLLGETQNARQRWAILGGFIGVLIILRPGAQVFDPAALIALFAALLFAVYQIVTRYVARDDSAMTSFFWTGVAGAGAMTLIVPFFWTPLRGEDFGYMGALCLTSVLGHYLLIRALDTTGASVIQPFAYLQLVFVAVIGIAVFGEFPDIWTVLGALLIIATGLIALAARPRRKRVAAR